MAGGLDDERLTTAGLFFEAHAALIRALEQALEAEAGLTGQWFEILLRLGRSPSKALRMSDLSAQTALTPSGLTRAVDRLEDAGLVCRKSCPEDRRGAFATLTPAGRARIEAAVDAHLAHLDEYFFAHLTARERAQLEAITRKLRDQLHPGATQLTGCPVPPAD
ncbi:MAG: MarR family winged helix-turn-helix transcriptional regulator [Acidimicrobiales bacterium]